MNEREYAITLLNAVAPVIEQVEEYYYQSMQLRQRSEVMKAEANRVAESKRARLVLPAILLLMIGGGFGLTGGDRYVFPMILCMLAAGAEYFLFAIPHGRQIVPDKDLLAQADAVAEHADSLEEQLQEYAASQQAILSRFPDDYQYSKAISFMRRALANGRADSLKEVINLYEDELYKENMAAEMQRQHEEQLSYLRAIENQTARAANNAAAAADIALINTLRS